MVRLMADGVMWSFENNADKWKCQIQAVSTSEEEYVEMIDTGI